MRIGWMWPLILLLLATSCTPDETLPPERSSASYSMSGTHFVPLAGAPDEFRQTQELKKSVENDGWSTPPVALHDPLSFAIGSRMGRIYFYDNNDSLANVIDLGSREPIDQLLVDTSSLYAITVSGLVEAFTFAGRERWLANVGAPSGNALIGSNSLFLPLATGLQAILLTTGKPRWAWKSFAPVTSLALAPTRGLLAACVTHNSSDVQDSVHLCDLNGTLKADLSLGGRLTSNVAFCGKNENVLVAGVLVSSDTNALRTSELRQLDLANPAGPVTRSIHSLPYLIFSVGANSTAVVVNGMRTTSGAMVSGADAFSIEDTTSLWRRRFTEPLVNPMAVSNGNIYFTITFQTEAIVASKGLFITLDAGTGKTVSQRAIGGVMNGFVPAMPMPDERGRLLFADRDKMIVYILDRSTLKRFF